MSGEAGEFRIAVIGAGVVGLAVAERLSKLYRGIVFLEKNDSFGQETSSRNSEVIHGGIYYPPGSLKATLCREGNLLLVYPVPSEGRVGLGIHATIDLAGRVRFGPDVEYVDRIDYAVDEGKGVFFREAVRSYLPSIVHAALEPDQCGIRPKLQGPGEPFRDFVIREESDSGLPGLINLIGIESPGLTASPALAEHVASLVEACL